MRRILLSTLFCCALALPAAAAPVPAATPAAPAPATPAAPALQFKDIGKITSWQPGGDFVMYVQTDKGNWYKVSLYEPCMRLFPGKDPTFATETDEQMNRASSVMIARHKCQVTSITPSAAPAH
jgi:hypothetical protein